jgi:ribosomal protein S18 acetylase RimI-like enzyme
MAEALQVKTVSRMMDEAEPTELGLRSTHMATQLIATDTILVPDAPALSGLGFRRFRGESDYPKMVAVVGGSKDADQIERVDSVEQVAQLYAHLTNCDPYQDMIFVEIDGEVVGYSRVTWWQEEATGDRIYFSFGFLLPEWRRQGIGRAVLRHNQRRLREIAATHPDDGARYFQSESGDTEHATTALLLSDGYQPVTYGAIMVRPDLENIPEAPMPEGLEVRPVQEEHLRTIWAAEQEAFRDHWGYTPDEVTYEAFLAEPHVDHSLWRVAWDGDQVAGMVRSFIDPEENTEYNRLRGWTENISVRRPWRRRGLARSLLVQSLHAIKERGMTEAALGVHTENPNGAFQLYESVGFRVVKIYTVYRKPMT